MLKLENIIKSIKDCVFPVFCFSCKKEGVWLCSECFAKMELNAQKACPVCHQYNDDGGACFDCKKQTFLDGHLAFMKYEESEIIGGLVHSLKYNYAKEVFAVLEKIISGSLPQHLYYFNNIDLIIPVPLHGRRLAERGFNQAELIAETVARFIQKEIMNKILVRQRYTFVQARLNREERLRNVSGAFSLNEVSKIKDKNILLVDDVFTTGSTMQECARLLKQNGASQVFGFTVARG